MTDSEFRTALTALNWTQGEAARRLGLSLRTINRYATGEKPIRRPVELVMKEALRWHASPTRERA